MKITIRSSVELQGRGRALFVSCRGWNFIRFLVFGLGIQLVWRKVLIRSETDEFQGTVVLYLINRRQGTMGEKELISVKKTQLTKRALKESVFSIQDLA